MVKDIVQRSRPSGSLRSSAGSASISTGFGRFGCRRWRWIDLLWCCRFSRRRRFCAGLAGAVRHACLNGCRCSWLRLRGRLRLGEYLCQRQFDAQPRLPGGTRVGRGFVKSLIAPTSASWGKRQRAFHLPQLVTRHIDLFFVLVLDQQQVAQIIDHLTGELTRVTAAVKRVVNDLRLRPISSARMASTSSVIA